MMSSIPYDVIHAVLEDALFKSLYEFLLLHGGQQFLLLPAPHSEERVTSLLDIACGSGAWACHIARRYPDLDIVGINKSLACVKAAQMWAAVRGLENATFLQKDLLQISSQERRYDVVRGHVIFYAIPPEAHQSLLNELVRVCTPGGTVFLKEWNISQTNSEACYQWLYTLRQAAIRAGYSPDFIYGMANRLKLAGCASVDQSLETLDVSSGSSAHTTLCESIISVFVI